MEKALACYHPCCPEELGKAALQKSLGKGILRLGISNSIAMAKPKWLHIAGLKMGKSAYEILKFSIDFLLQIIVFLLQIIDFSIEI